MVGSRIWQFTADNHFTYDIETAEQNYPSEEDKQ